MKTPLPIPVTPAGPANYGELLGRLVLCALIIAGLFAGIAARWQ